MGSAASTPDIVFRGTDGTEAEELIGAIERLAFVEGWSKDRERMLLFARSCLRHKALRWFAKLDPPKKNDWDLFVEALFEQYPLVETPTEAKISTPVWSTTTFSPGASTAILPSDQALNSRPMHDERHATGINVRYSVSPPKPYDPSILGRQLGILRIVVEDGTTSPQYIWRGPHVFGCSVDYDEFRTTADRQEALVVCFIPTPEPHPIACLNAAYGLSELFLYYTADDPLEHQLYGRRGVVEIPRGGQHPGFVSKVWNVAPDGSLEASLAENDPSDDRTRLDTFKTSEVHLDTAGFSIRFMKPGTPLWQDDPRCNNGVDRFDFKARIVFEPL